MSPIHFKALGGFAQRCGNVATHGGAVDASSGSHGPGAPALGNGCVQSSREFSEGGCGAVPAQLVHVVEERDVGPKRGKRAKEQRALQLAAKSVCERTRVGGVHVPLAAVQWDGFEMDKLGKDG